MQNQAVNSSDDKGGLQPEKLFHVATLKALVMTRKTLVLGSPDCPTNTVFLSFSVSCFLLFDGLVTPTHHKRHNLLPLSLWDDGDVEV